MARSGAHGARHAALPCAFPQRSFASEASNCPSERARAGRHAPEPAAPMLFQPQVAACGATSARRAPRRARSAALSRVPRFGAIVCRGRLRSDVEASAGYLLQGCRTSRGVYFAV